MQNNSQPGAPQKVKCKGCPSWDADRPGTSNIILGLCRNCTLGILEESAVRQDPVIVRDGHVPAVSKRERLVNGIKIFWWKGKWRAE